MNSVGDTSLVLNGVPKHFPLMTGVKDFMKIVQEKGAFVFEDADSKLVAHLGSGVVSCRVDTALFKHPRPYHHGEAELEIHVGGKEFFKAWVHPDSYTMRLKYDGK